jgi:enoyl-CoA hydratase/carnithine racemase
MPPKAVAHLVYSAEPIAAPSALAAGLVSRVVEPAGLEGAIDSFIARLLTFAPEAVLAVKQYLATAPRFAEAQAALYGGSLLANVLSSR